MINPIDFDNVQELPKEFLEEMSNNECADQEYQDYVKDKRGE